MRVVRCILVILCVPIASVNLKSQQTAATIQRDAQAISLLQQSLAVMGGANLAAIQDTRTTVQFRNNAANASFPFTATITTKGANLLRVDSQFPEGTSTFVISDTDASSETPGKDISKFSRLSLGSLIISHLPVLMIQAQSNTVGAQIRYIGLEQDGASSVYHLTIQQPLKATDDLGTYDAPCDIFVDAKTSLITKMIGRIRPPLDLTITEEFEVRYGDYRPVGGILVPFVVAYSIGNDFVSEQRVLQFEINTAVPSSIFDAR
jgi:hypothetical protein